MFKNNTKLSPKESELLKHRLKRTALAQFIRCWQRERFRSNDSPTWGDEVEFTLVKFDEESKAAKLLLKGSEVIEKLRSMERGGTDPVSCSIWNHEAGEFQVEATPGIVHRI